MTKSDIVEELTKIINYMDKPTTDGDFPVIMGRGVNRLEKLRADILLDIHQ